MIPRIFIGIASTGFNTDTFTLCLAKLCCYFPCERLSPECDSQELTVEGIQSSGIAHNYNQIVLLAKKWKATHLLTLETDMGFASNVPHILYKKHQLWVGANYPMKCSDPCSFTALALNNKERVITHQNSNGLEACTYTGMGVTLFDMQLFEKVEQPWFEMKWLGNDHYATQDAFLAQRCLDSKSGIISYVDHDCSKLVWHQGPKNYTWKDVIEDMEKRVKEAKDKESSNGK